MPKVFILSGCRTAIGSFQGQFEKYPASELGSITIREAISKANIKPEDVDECIMGHEHTLKVPNDLGWTLKLKL